MYVTELLIFSCANEKNEYKRHLMSPHSFIFEKIIIHVQTRFAAPPQNHHSETPKQ